MKLASLGLALFALASSASAAIIGQATFICLNDGSAACATLGTQMRIQVTDEAPAGQIDVRIQNLGPLGSIIGEVFFDTGTTSFLDSIASLSQVGPGNVKFEDAGSGQTLPGGNGNPWLFSSDLGAARMSKGGIDNGIDVGEELRIIFNLAPGKTLADLAATTGGPLDLAKLRVGIHVQSIDGFEGGSRGMIAGGPIGTPRDIDPVPEPSTYVLGGAALAAMGLIRKFKRS